MVTKMKVLKDINEIKKNFEDECKKILMQKNGHHWIRDAKEWLPLKKRCKNLKNNKKFEMFVEELE